MSLACFIVTRSRSISCANRCAPASCSRVATPERADKHLRSCNAMWRADAVDVQMEAVCLLLRRGGDRADDPNTRHGQDRDCINPNQPYEVAHWTKAFGGMGEELQKAVAAAGDRADGV